MDESKKKGRMMTMNKQQARIQVASYLVFISLCGASAKKNTSGRSVKKANKNAERQAQPQHNNS